MYCWSTVTHSNHPFPTNIPINTKQSQTLAELKPPASDISALSEHQSKQLIKAWDIPITNETLVSTSAEAVMVANQIGYPVVLKVDSANILHTT